LTIVHSRIRHSEIMAFTFFATLFFLQSFISNVIAETHTVSFDNQCGYGTPQLIQGNDVLTTTTYTFNTTYSGIAYLQTGDCGFNGETCGIVEMTLINPTTAGGGSSADISYIPPLAYSVPYAFSYYGGCDGQGASCNSADCSEAFYTPDETYVQVACQDDNVNLLITFCGDGSSSSATTSSSSTTTPTTSVETSSTAVESSSTVVESSSTAVASPTTTEATSTVASSTVSTASSTSSSGRCSSRNRRRRIESRDSDKLSHGLRSHRRRSPKLHDL